ncbi:MAG: glycosyltransferase family 39 protein [Anaerolineae bacterium]|nr:glycosyltransferase family 39 protein [Anaerolineae bacterium]
MAVMKLSRVPLRWSGLGCVAAGQALLLVLVDAPGVGLIFVVTGMALLALTWRRAALPPFRFARPAPLRPARRQWLLMVGGAAAGVWLSYRLVDKNNPPLYFEQAALGLLSLGLFLLGAARPRRCAVPLRVVIPLAILTLFALGVRLFDLEYGVPVLYVDEAPFASYARQIAEEGLQEILFGPGHYSHPALFEGMLAPCVAALGRTRTAVRLLPAVLGALTAPALYWLGVELFNRRVGWIAAAFLAAYPVHIHFSRFALNNVIDPLFGVLAFAALARGLRRGGAGWFALAGVTLGLSQAFYVGGRILPPLMLLFLAMLYLDKTYRRAVRAHTARLALAFAGFVLTTLPANVYLLANGLPLTWRAWASFDRYAFLDDTFFEVLQRKIIPAALAFIHTPDGFYFYGGYTPMLLFLPAVAFLVGMAWLLLSWKRARGVLLLSWLLAPAAGSMFLREVPGYARLVILTPALGLVVALGVDRLVWHLAPRLRAYGLRAAVAAVALAGALNVVYYFGVHLDDFAKTANDNPDIGRWMQQVGESARTLPYKTAAVFLTEPEMKYNAYWIYNYHNGSDEVWWANPYPVEVLDELDNSGRPYAVFFSENYRNMLSELIRIHPDADLRWLPGTPEGRAALIRFYRVP